MLAQLVILFIWAAILVVIVTVVRRAKRTPAPASTKQANMFRLHWSDYGWGRRIGIIAGFILMAAGALGVVGPSFRAAIHLSSEVNASVFLGCVFVVLIGFGLLTRLSSRFYGLGWTAMLLGVVGLEVTQSPKENDASVGAWVIMLMAYWLVRMIQYVSARIRQRKRPASV